MRVQLIVRRRSGEEQGAVAIVVAILLSVLMIISAFAVDFGLAYSVKRQLQTSADAAALAAARTLADDQVSCSGLSDGAQPNITDVTPPVETYASLVSQAEAAGQALMVDNAPSATYVAGSLAITCQGGAINVTWENTETSDVGLGGVAGVSDIENQRQATAALDVPPGVATGLRPFPFCSKYVQFSSLPSRIIRVEGPTTSGGPAEKPATTSSADPGCPKPGGNWYHANCPGVTNNGTPQLGEAILEGCDGPVTQAIDGTPPPPSYASLTPACPAMSPYDPTVADDCLNADPGNFNVPLSNDWETVMLRREPIVIPVFCGESICTPPAVDLDGGGNVTQYPVYRLMAIQVCGFHFGNPNNRGQIYDGLCAPSNMPPGPTDAFGFPTPYDAQNHGNNQSNYFLVSFTQLLVGPVIGASTCTIGDPTCDGGLRRVTLVR